MILRNPSLITSVRNATLRQGCCCDSADNLTCVLLEGAGTVRNISLRVVKE